MSKEIKNLNENDSLKHEIAGSADSQNNDGNGIDFKGVNGSQCENEFNDNDIISKLDNKDSSADTTLGGFSDSALAEGVVSNGIFGDKITIQNPTETDEEKRILENHTINDFDENSEFEGNAISSEFDEMTNVIDGHKRKPRKKRRKTKVRKIVVRTYATVFTAVLCIVAIYFGATFFQIPTTQGMDGAELKVDMTDLPYKIGTIGEVNLKTLFPNGDNFKKDGVKKEILRVSEDETEFTVTYNEIVEGVQTEKEQKFEVEPNAVNVDNWDDFAKELTTKRATEDDAEYAKICLQTPYIAAPSMEGTKKSKMSGFTVHNNIYGNGCTINVFEIVVCRNKMSGGALTKPYLQGNGPVQGWGAFNILPESEERQIVMQDLHIIGNDMNTGEGGNLAGVSDAIIEKRGLKLFSNYGYLISLAGEMKDNEPIKANFKLKHCVLENGHQIIHVRNSNMEMEGNIIRNASDTTISIATYANEKSIIKSKNNVIANSITGGVVFYCFDSSISAANADDSWNEFIIEKGSFLDIYNWKLQDGLAFMPETEGGADVANPVAKSEIPKAKYDSLKANVDGQKYIHFAIIKLRTGGGLPQNGSFVTNYKDIGYQTSRDKGYPNGFPLPGVAAAIIKDIDVWGYYEKRDKDVTPTSSLNQETVEKLYQELRDGR